MKNIEKYKETRDALEAWDAYHDGGGDMPFAAWAEHEYVEPREPTLLEKAKMFVDCVEMPSDPQEQKHWDGLCAAIKREKAKTVRNCDKYKTAEEALAGFRKFCYKVECSECRFRDCVPTCPLAWLYSEAMKEEAK